MYESVYYKAKNNLIGCVKARIEWYKKAISMQEGTLKYDCHFDFPTCSNGDVNNAVSVYEWRGALRELENTLNMLQGVLP